MAKTVSIPGIGDVDFPDSMSDEQIVKAIKENILPQNESMNAGRAAPSWQQSLANVAQGPSFGFSDEIGGAVGGVRSLLGGRPFGEGYTSTRDWLRGAADQFKKDNPIFAGVTRAMVAAPTMATPATSVFKGVGMLPRAGNAALTGLGFGSIAGAGESTADSALGVAQDAAQGGLFGASISGAAVPAMAAVTPVVKAVAGAFSSGSAGRYAKEKVAEALARDSINPDSALTQAAARFSKLGPEARVMDVGGQNTRQLLDTTATLPGATKQSVETAIRERQATRAGRLIGSAEDALNPSGLRLSETIDSLIAVRDSAAQPLYQKLYKRMVQVDDELRGLINAADELGAGAAAKKVAIARQSPYSLTADTPTASMRELDYLKQGLDDIIQANTDARGKMNKVGAAVVELKQSLTAALDKRTKGAYKTARDAFAGPSALMDAAEAGRRAMTMDDQQIGAMMRKMSDSEREAYRIGAFEALRAKLGRRAGQTEIMNLWREPAAQEKLKALFGSERSYREFASSVAAEARLSRMESVGRGSQTAARQFGAGDLDVSPILEAQRTISGAAQGNVGQMLSGAVNAWNRVQTPEPVRDAIGKLLLSRSPQDISALEELLKSVNASRAQTASRIGLLGGGFAAPSLLGQ